MSIRTAYIGFGECVTGGGCEPRKKHGVANEKFWVKAEGRGLEVFNLLRCRQLFYHGGAPEGGRT